ncbi:MAG: hypothetical protein PHQ27_05930 [Victivallales bacterium]|nr:hypothetical protein [Victivallales bacterium]
MNMVRGLGIAIICFGVCAPLTAWKVIPEKKDQASTIKTVIVSNGRMVIVNQQGKAIDVSFSDLEQLARGDKKLVKTGSKPQPASPPSPAVTAPATVTTAVASSPAVAASSAVVPDQAFIRQAIVTAGTWFVYTAAPGRFKIFGTQQYVPMKEGTLLKGVFVNKRLYLLSRDGVLFEPTWENNFDFSRYITEFGKYRQSLQQRLTDIDGNLAAAAVQREKITRDIYFLTTQVVQVLNGNDYIDNTIINSRRPPDWNFVSSNGLPPSSIGFYLDLRRKLSREERDRRKIDRQIEDLNKERNQLVITIRQCTEAWQSLGGK